MKFKSDKEFSTSDYGKMAVTGILSGALNTFDINVFIRIIVDVAVLLGWVCLFIWIYRKIKKIK